MNLISTSIALACISFIIIVIISVSNPGILKENATGKYSFSKFQLWIWTLIICPAFALHWGYNDNNKVELNETCLILLGIVAATRLTSTVINNAIAEPPANSLLKMNTQSKGFFKDILTDDSENFSITRLQNLIFTITYLVVFVSVFFKTKNLEYPVFENSSYILMGMSTGSYLVAKGLKK